MFFKLRVPLELCHFLKRWQFPDGDTQLRQGLMGRIDQWMHGRCGYQQWVGGNLQHVELSNCYFLFNRKCDHVNKLTGRGPTGYLAAKNNSRSVGEDQLDFELAGSGKHARMPIGSNGGGRHISKAFFLAGTASHPGAGKGNTAYYDDIDVHFCLLSARVVRPV